MNETNTGFTVTIHAAERLRPSVVVAVITASPAFNVVTTPSFTVATVSSDELHAKAVLSASTGDTVAVRVTVSPRTTSAINLSSVMNETNTGFTVTIHAAERLLPSVAVAVITASPAFNVVTTPSATVATVSSEELHTSVLLSASSGATVAVRVTVSPRTTSTFCLSRVTEDTQSGLDTTVQEAERLLPSVVVAVITVSPIFNVVTTPSTTVATVSSDEFQTKAVLSASTGDTVAVRVTVSPRTTSTYCLPRVMEDTNTSASNTFTTASTSATGTIEAFVVEQITFLISMIFSPIVSLSACKFK